MNEQDLIKQLNQLPKEIQAKDDLMNSQWAQIKQSIESDSFAQVATEIQPEPSRKKWFYPVSAVASLLLVAFIFFLNPSQQEVGLDLAQQKTIQSLQQANGQYYSLLGNMMQQNQTALPAQFEITLKDLRQAQKAYRMELAQNPENTKLYRKLIKTYQVERKLLRSALS